MLINIFLEKIIPRSSKFHLYRLKANLQPTLYNIDLIADHTKKLQTNRLTDSSDTYGIETSTEKIKVTIDGISDIYMKGGQHE